MAKRKIGRTRLRVAGNPSTPKEVLGFLSVDPNPGVRIAVGINPLTPHAIGYGFAVDADLNVRFGLAEDITCPIKLVDKLSQESNSYLSCRANQTMQLRLAEGRLTNLDCQRLFCWGSDSDQSGVRYA